MTLCSVSFLWQLHQGSTDTFIWNCSLTGPSWNTVGFSTGPFLYRLYYLSLSAWLIQLAPFIVPPSWHHCVSRFSFQIHLFSISTSSSLPQIHNHSIVPRVLSAVSYLYQVSHGSRVYKFLSTDSFSRISIMAELCSWLFQLSPYCSSYFMGAWALSTISLSCSSIIAALSTWLFPLLLYIASPYRQSVFLTLVPFPSISNMAALTFWHFQLALLFLLDMAVPIMIFFWFLFSMSILAALCVVLSTSLFLQQVHHSSILYMALSSSSFQ